MIQWLIGLVALHSAAGAVLDRRDNGKAATTPTGRDHTVGKMRGPTCRGVQHHLGPLTTRKLCHAAVGPRKLRAVGMGWPR
jgi:hypothetical protein|eukprot:COSAG06_NODE_4945_length_3841_cov_3.660075_1_plen_81_part_00